MLLFFMLSNHLVRCDECPVSWSPGSDLESSLVSLISQCICKKPKEAQNCYTNFLFLKQKIKVSMLHCLSKKKQTII